MMREQKIDKSKSVNLKRGLKNRHLTMMALGGPIGTGLFLGSGSVIHTAGPGGAIFSYLLVAILVFFVMTSLSEMAAYLPVTGSFCDYSAKFVDKSFGFAMSWNYWVNWALVVASEVIAAGIVMRYWFPDISVSLWSSMIFLIILMLNLIGIRLYGEIEYWLSFVKLSTIIIFIIIGALAILGLTGHGGFVGFSNFTVGNAPFNNGWLGFFAVFFTVGYAFQGLELVGVSIGEAENPKEAIRKSSKQIFWRILLFYILTIIVISFLVPYTSRHLNNAESSVVESPFTLIFASSGFKYAASIINVVIVTAIISTANASLYTTSRVLWHIGRSCDGPKCFARTNKRGVPVIAIATSSFFAGLFVLSSKFFGGVIFNWLMNVIGVAGYIAWFGICLSHYRFRKAYTLQGKKLSDLPYQAHWFPYAPLVAMALMGAMIIGQEVMVILNGEFSINQLFTSNCGLAVFFAMVLVHKAITKTKLVPLSHCPTEKIHA